MDISRNHAHHGKIGSENTKLTPSVLSRPSRLLVNINLEQNINEKFVDKLVHIEHICNSQAMIIAFAN